MSFTLNGLANAAGAYLVSHRLSIARINKFLDDLALAAAADKADKANSRVKIFRELARSLTAIQHKWLIRIILKELKVGVRRQTIAMCE